MIGGVDLGENKNLFVVSTILVCGIGGLVINVGKITITAIAVALILGIIVNLILKDAPEGEDSAEEEAPKEADAEENKEA